MRFREEIRLHGVALTVMGEWEPAEPQTWDYPGSEASVNVTRYEIGGVDVGNLVDAADWYEEIDALVLAAVGVPCFA